jgi:hypothetical protein
MLTVRKLIDSHPGQIRLVFKNRPLEIHPGAILLHEAAMAANAQGKFWQMPRCARFSCFFLNSARVDGVQNEKLYRDIIENQLAARNSPGQRTDPEARLYKKSLAGPSKPNYLGHVVTENKNGLIMESCLTETGKKAEREAALAMMSVLAPGNKEIT